jgi:hypothetical protein
MLPHVYLTQARPLKEKGKNERVERKKERKEGKGRG